jgi:hypothetical protein
MTYVPIKIAEQLYNNLGFKTSRTYISKDAFFLHASCPQGIKEAPHINIKIGSLPTSYAGDWISKDCRSSVIGDSRLDQGQFVVLGVNFLKNVHLVVDRDQYKMGFAQRVISSDEYQT